MNRISDFVEVKNSRVRTRYAGDKVAVAHFIEDYMHQRIDLTRDFKDVMKHKSDIFTWAFTPHHLRFILTRFIPEVLIHSQKQDERIVRGHYDDKNDLFYWFLGPRMIYTSCYFRDEKESLEIAQDNKMDLIARKMQLKPGETLLDIGCGWGTLVTHMAKHYGVDATGVTIAEAGARWSRRLIEENGVGNTARVLRMDYRDIPRKKYDKIACLEMAEHVGVKNFRRFMKQCYDMLEDDGIFYLQIAGLRQRGSVFHGPNQEDIVWGLFMSEYIFSGADASMPVSWDLAQIEKAGFEIHSLENIGIHYSKTIDYWYHNWLTNREKVVAKYGEYIFRQYQVFLGWSVEIGRQGSSSAYQITCHKNINTFDRPRFVWPTQGGSVEFRTTGSVSSMKTAAELVSTDR